MQVALKSSKKKSIFNNIKNTYNTIYTQSFILKRKDIDDINSFSLFRLAFHVLIKLIKMKFFFLYFVARFGFVHRIFARTFYAS